jgi:hypothetical protein
MKPKLLLTLAAIYISLIGLLALLIPATTVYEIDVASPDLLNARFRIPHSLFIGFAILDWFARNAEASKARDAIFLGNTVGFALWAILVALVALIPGYDPSGLVFVVINLLFTVAFFVVGRANMSTSVN